MPGSTSSVLQFGEIRLIFHSERDESLFKREGMEAGKSCHDDLDRGWTAHVCGASQGGNDVLNLPLFRIKCNIVSQI